MDIKKVIGSVMEYGGFQKIDGNSNRVLAIGALILSYLAVIMKETQLLTRLCVVIEALFFGAIYGVDITRMVSDEVYSKHVFQEQRHVFLPWKTLCTIDLSLSGPLT
jgi:hypothetical protein